MTSHGQLYKGYDSLISRRRFFLRRRKKSRGRARGEKERLKKVNRRLLHRLRLPQKKKQQIKQRNRQQQQTRQNHCPLMRIDKPLGFHGLRKVIVTRHTAHEKAVGSRATPFA